MPTYSYACTACDHRFDAQQSFSDDALTECPQCSGRLRKLFNAVGVVFKGSGFYRTDSRSASSSATGGGASSGASSSPSTTGGSSSSSSGSSSSGSSSSGSSSSSGASSTAPSAKAPAAAG